MPRENVHLPPPPAIDRPGDGSVAFMHREKNVLRDPPDWERARCLNRVVHAARGWDAARRLG